MSQKKKLEWSIEELDLGLALENLDSDDDLIVDELYAFAGDGCVDGYDG